MVALLDAGAYRFAQLLAKSASYGIREIGWTALADADLVKYKYRHGWILIGGPEDLADRHVHHDKYGHGKITHLDEAGRAHVKFDSGASHSFEHRTDAGGPRFEQRAPKPRAPRKPKADHEAQPSPVRRAPRSREPDPRPSGYVGPRYQLPAKVRQADIDTLRRRARSDLAVSLHASRGMSAPDQETEDLVKRIGPGHATRAAWEADADVAVGDLLHEGYPPNPEKVAKAKAELADQFRRDLAGKKIASRVTEDGLLRLLADGRFKSQFETKKSKGLYSPKWRARVEQALFGLGHRSDPAERPVYGYVRMGDDGPDSALRMYGDVQVVLRDHVRNRTTATLGDSLNYGVLPSPVDDPSWESTNPALRISRGHRGVQPFDYGSFQDDGYVEAQIHGGVSTDDIERVVLPSQPTVALREALQRRGIPWEVKA